MQGVGEIVAIEEREFDGEMILYYVIYIASTEMTVMVPTTQITKQKIRSIVSSRKANKALDILAEEGEAVPADWKMRYQYYLDSIKKGTLFEIAKVVRSLYQRKLMKDLPIMERKMLDSTLGTLADEISIALKIDREIASEKIYKILQQSIALLAENEHKDNDNIEPKKNKKSKIGEAFEDINDSDEDLSNWDNDE